MVHTIKIALAEVSPSELEITLQHFLTDYRNTVHPVTKISGHDRRQTTQNVFGFNPTISNQGHCRKQVKQMWYYGSTSSRMIHFSDSAWAKNYLRGREKWIEASVSKQLEASHFRVYISSLGLSWTRHADQLKKRGNLSYQQKD